MKIENNNSKWEFWDLFDKTVKNLNNKEHSNNSIIERALIRFVERLPSRNYENIRGEWNKR
jgi:hypothetical protein